MFIWKATVILDEIKSYLPDLCSKLQNLAHQPVPPPLVGGGRGRGEYFPPSSINPKLWHTITSISIDYGVLEKSKKGMVIPAKDLGWSDLGSWSALSDIQKKDAAGNVLEGDCLDLDSRNTTVLSQNHLVATIGLRDVIVVDTEDALLVCDKGRTEDVKKVVENIKERRRQEHFSHKTVKRPWGAYTVINNGNGFKVKLVVIAPKKRLSLQRHLKRSEHWVVVEGEAKITVDRDVYYRKANESIYVPKKGVHRLENATNCPLKIVEVQCGAYLEEDDIERIEDDFTR
jgi:mannose-1-phosphate guanylyltransferase/mannose-6-phosphate isomerase